MTQNTLQCEDVATVDHEVAGKSVTQYMRKLAERQVNVGAINGLLERSRASGEHRAAKIGVLGMVLVDLFFQRFNNGTFANWRARPGAVVIIEGADYA